jgi:hypothetical protein
MILKGRYTMDNIIPIIPRIDICDYILRIKKEISNRVEMEIIHPNPKSGNISFFELVALNLLVKELQVVSIMEFGTFNGRTTINMSANVSFFGGKIYTVDLPSLSEKTKFPIADGKHDSNDERGFIGIKNKLFNNDYRAYKKAPIEQIWSDTAYLQINEYKNTIDFLFIDASHSYENCLNDSHIAKEIVCHSAGYIVWHDYNGWPGVTKAVHEFAQTNNHMEFFWINDTSMVIVQNKKG